MIPVNEISGPFLRRAFQPLVDAGFVEFVYGGAEEGTLVCNHHKVTSVHLTGSEATYDAIVWQGKKPKVGTPPFTKPVAAELGCVTPYIVVPSSGKTVWSDADVQYHAETVVTGLAQNAGHNCLKTEILVTDAEWPQRQQFVDAVKAKLAATPTRSGYYPGTAEKFKAFKARFPDAEELGKCCEREERIILYILTSVGSLSYV